MTSRQRVFQPGFIPGSLYLAIISPSGSPQAGFLGFFYLERPTTRPNESGVLQGQYWLLAPTLGLQKGYMTVQAALYDEKVLGYARVAENVDLRRLAAQITQDDHKVAELGWSSEQWAFNAIDRLRRQRIVRSVLWTFDFFQAEVENLRNKWMEERRVFEAASEAAQKRCPKGWLAPTSWRARAFTEFFLCELSTQEH
ncbi:hypothetical protein D9756_001120 [Leucocoprinus leucothites]|uniref:Uncharacterized protein n=1 Tax=Leucocoprinus leucothites TaxID=201217 RepID=A0A8H5GES8_9AGAR|nr:hypothetical protein D9756_001120 [Leucoagaricus leucothites]